MKKTQESRNATYLRVAINEHLKWSDHIETIFCKANSVNAFKIFKENINFCPSQITKMCYLAVVHVHDHFGVFVGCMVSHHQQLYTLVQSIGSV